MFSSRHGGNLENPTLRTTLGIVIFDNFALEAIDLVMSFSNRIIHVRCTTHVNIIYRWTCNKNKIFWCEILRIIKPDSSLGKYFYRFVPLERKSIISSLNLFVYRFGVRQNTYGR